MKLLFDQNISFRILQLIEDIYPDANQIYQLGLKDKTDKEIWEYAKLNDFTIVTFDGDFYDFSLVWGHPTKIIWLRVANHVTKEVANVLRAHYNNIIMFNQNHELACLEIIQKNP